MALTDKQADIICEYITYLRNQLFLKDWSIKLRLDEHSEEGTHASIEPFVGRKLAILRLCEGFCDLSIKDQTHTLCHELIHLHHIAASDIIRLDLLQELSQSTYNVLLNSFKRQMEYCVDGLADAFSLLVEQIDYNEESTSLET